MRMGTLCAVTGSILSNCRALPCGTTNYAAARLIAAALDAGAVVTTNTGRPGYSLIRRNTTASGIQTFTKISLTLLRATQDQPSILALPERSKLHHVAISLVCQNKLMLPVKRFLCGTHTRSRSQHTRCPEMP